MASQQEEDPGFQALLKPIQDLTRNWEVDLCLHLEEYIHYIRQICGDNIPDMNFAQAAVLVQNSASIYSKKVDFLFTTVLQLLETLTKKQTEAKNRASQEDGAGAEAGPSTGRRRKVIIDLDDFSPVDNIAADRPPRLDIEKERKKVEERRKKAQIVLNAAIKVKSKENTTCNIYDYSGNIMGKKDEFRLNWRVSSDGTLHEEFLINQNRFKVMEPVELTVIDNANFPANDSIHDYEDAAHESYVGENPLPENPEQPLFTSLVNGPDRESEDRALREKRNSLYEKEECVDIHKIAWEPNDFNHNIPEKPFKKRTVSKVPSKLDDENKKRKFNKEASVIPYIITEEFFDKYKISSYSCDPDFGYQAKEALKCKRLLLQDHRNKYFDYIERFARGDEVNDFPGFVDDDDNDDHDFGGFGEDVCEDAPEVDVPLPDNALILDHAKDDNGWRGDAVNTYDNEAMKTLQAFRSRKIDHSRISDLAKRVDEWHQKILPKLEAAEQRSSFDIHGYGTKVIDSFKGGIGTTKTFAEIVGGESREEVTRYFLSSLLLANQYNVEITKTDPTELSVDCMQMKLLSVVRHHDEMDDNLRETAHK